MQQSRDNHYVPQFYLKRWSTNGHSVLDYRTIVHHPNEPIWKRSSIKSVACWRDLYTEHDRESIDTKIENFFANHIEAPSKPVFQKLDNGESLSSRDMETLVNLLIAQLFRTPHAMAKEAQLMRGLFGRTVQETSETVARELIHGDVNPSSMVRDDYASTNQPFPATPLYIDLDRSNNEMIVTTTVGRQGFLSAFGNFYYGRVGEALRSYLWRIVQMPIGAEMPTSDNPVTVFRIGGLNKRLIFNDGIGIPNTIILFPLDPRHALFTKVGMPFHQLLRFEPDAYDSRLFIKAIAQNVSWHIFSKSRIPAIQDIRPREANPEKATRLMTTRQKWDEMQVEVDERLSL